MRALLQEPSSLLPRAPRLHLYYEWVENNLPAFWPRALVKSVLGRIRAEICLRSEESYGIELRGKVPLIVQGFASKCLVNMLDVVDSA